MNAEIKNTVGVPACLPSDATREMQEAKDGLSAFFIILAVILLFIASVMPED